MSCLNTTLQEGITTQILCRLHVHVKVTFVPTNLPWREILQKSLTLSPELSSLYYWQQNYENIKYNYKL